MADGADALPPEVSEEILRWYADILRVGRIRVNGAEAAWNTDTSTELQLQGFCAALFERLSAILPEVANREPATLCLAAYWLCKSVSINYALIEVLLMVRRRVGVLCTIETREQGGDTLVEYNVDVLPGPSMRVSLAWRRGENIVYCNPVTAEHQVKGSLSLIATEFRLPPDPNYVPSYTLKMRLHRSLASNLMSRIVCGGRKARCDSEAAIEVDGPLWSSEQAMSAAASSSLEADGTPATAMGEEEGYALEPCGSDSLSSGSATERLGESQPLLPPLYSTMERPWLCDHNPSAASHLFEDTPNVGSLEVRTLQVSSLSAGAIVYPELYLACTVAGNCERSRRVSSTSDPEWPETWRFPLRIADLRGEVLVELFGDGAVDGVLKLLGCASIPVSRVLSWSGGVAVTEPLKGTSQGVAKLELQLLTEVSPIVHASHATARHSQGSSTAGQMRVQVRAAPTRKGACSSGLWCSSGAGQ